MDRTRVYLSGPMSGYAEHNFPAFHRWAGELRAAGFEVVNPAELNPKPGLSWEECLRVDIRELCSCAAIALMPGWEASKGANLELHLAHRLGMEVMHLPMRFDLVQHLYRQAAFSARTFGPGDRTTGVCDHIRKELIEVQDAENSGTPTLPEWIDVIILGFDGAWRSGATPEQIVAALESKHGRNEHRIWPDWRTADPTKAIEHVRAAESL